MVVEKANLKSKASDFINELQQINKLVKDNYISDFESFKSVFNCSCSETRSHNTLKSSHQK